MIRPGIIVLTIILVLLIKTFVFAQQTEKVTAKFYKDPDFEINTPGVKMVQEFMKYDDMMNYLKGMEGKRNDVFRIEYCGLSKLNKKIPVVHIEKKGPRNTLKVWMQGGLHGNEPAGTESVLMFIGYLINSDQLDRILDKLSFAFIPMANIDGYEKQQRDNLNNVDLNRDQVTLQENESVFLKQAFTTFSPQVAIDLHEFRPFRKELDRFSTEKLGIAQDVLFLPSGNLNIPEELRILTNDLFLKNIKESLHSCNLTYGNYFVPVNDDNGINFLQMGGDSPRSSSTSYGLANAVSILFEIRGIGLGHRSYKRRVYTGFLIAKSVMETTLKNKKTIARVINTAVSKTIKRENNIVLNSAPDIYKGRMDFIAIDRCELIPLEVQIQDTWRSKAVTTRNRPSAYILMPENTGIVTKLKILGVKADTLRHDVDLRVEIFTEGRPISGTVETGSFILSEQNRHIPAGSFLIPTAQKNANFAVSTMEPEMENGYYRYNMIRKNANGEIPVYRLNISENEYKKIIEYPKK